MVLECNDFSNVSTIRIPQKVYIGCTPENLIFWGLEWDLRICIFDKLLG